MIQSVPNFWSSRLQSVVRPGLSLCFLAVGSGSTSGYLPRGMDTWRPLEQNDKMEECNIFIKIPQARGENFPTMKERTCGIYMQSVGTVRYKTPYNAPLTYPATSRGRSCRIALKLSVPACSTGHITLH